ncbi:MAG: GTPase domain-containing protein [Selenomonadaceae bacterium]|nr:GTPase domain-containing protein [Selenomonadaceae bacterium]
MEEFQLSKFTKEGAQLLRDVTDEFNRLGIDASRFPKTFPDDSGKIKLVFVGQYSAGKSSIIKMLTGEDVAIGAAITTQDSTPYEWNGLEIIDTPGIETELRPDHDEITYEQINHAALLIFVITNEGFSQRMGDHFRTLAIDQKRAANMVLVVNKMDRTALGNVPEQQQVIYEDLKKVTTPHDPKDLYVSFVDTASYFKAMQETDERRKNRRLERSGHDIFVANLNRFVAQKGVFQKINLPLNTIAAEIRNASGGSSDKEKADVAAYVETICHSKKILLNAKRECLEDIDGIISNFKIDVSRRGRDTAESALSQKSEDVAKQVLADAQERVKLSTEDCAQKISDRIKRFSEQSDENLKTYESSTFVQQVQANFLANLNVQGVDGLAQGIGAAVGTGGAVAGAAIAQHGAQFAAQYAQTAVTPLGRVVAGVASEGVGGALTAQGVHPFISDFLGGQAGNLLTKIPIFRAEPTMLNKIARVFTNNAGKIGTALGILGALWTIYSIIKGDEENRKRESEQQKAKNNIISGFNDLAEDIGRELSSNVRNFMTQNVDPIISAFDEKIKAVEAMTANEKIKSEKLSELLNQTENLIGEIQSCK